MDMNKIYCLLINGYIAEKENDIDKTSHCYEEAL
jgi:hypothetical protein